MPTIDSYTSSDRTTFLSSSAPAVSQSFASSNSYTLTNAMFRIKRTSTTSGGNIVAEIYDHSGTYGTSSIPTGSPLATSDGIAIGSISTSETNVSFTFSGAQQIEISNGQKYVVVLNASNLVDPGDLSFANDSTSPTHSGNRAVYVTPNWLAGTDYDLYFSTTGTLITTRYWVGNGGNWSDTSHWAASSGGTGGALSPTSADDIYFDANSFSTTGQTVTLNTFGYCKSMDWTGATNSPTFYTASNVMRIYGSVTLISSMTRTGTQWSLAALSGNHSITSAGKTFDSIYFGFDGGTATWTIQDKLTATGTMVLYQGSFNANNFDVTAGSFTTSTRAALKTITMGSGTWTITSGGFDISINSGFLTLNANTSKLIISSTSGTSKTVNTSTFTLYNVEFSGNNITWTGATTVNNLELNNAGLANGLLIGTGTKTINGTLTNNGTAGNLTLLRASPSGTARTLSKASGVVSLDYADIKDSTATGGAEWFAGDNSVNSGNNSGWTFTRPLYFISATINGTSTFSATAKGTYYPSVTIDGTSTIVAYGVLITDQSASPKTYLYKVYDTSDNFLGLWNDVSSDFAYSQEINSTGSAIQVELARTSDTKVIEYEDLNTTQTPEAITTFDGNTLIMRHETLNNIGPGSDVDVNYRVEVWVFYGSRESLETTSGELILTNDDEEIFLNIGAVNGLRKFNGFISRYISRYGSTDSVLVSLVSFGWDLDHYVIKSGTDTTVTYNSTAPNAILTAALDNFASQGGLTTYSGTSVQATGTTVSYTFRLNTFAEVIKKCLELAPSDWSFYVGLGDDLVYFFDRPSTPAHYFVLGEHIEELNLEYYIEDITNLVYFTGDETAGVSLFKVYTDATSISNYRQGLKRLSDHRVSLTATADLLGEAEIDRNDTPRYRSSITILSVAYDTESITLGQLIGFRNFGNYVDNVTMQIVGIDYEPDRVRLQLDTLLPRVNKRVEDIRRNLVEVDNQNIPNAPS